MSLQSTLTSVLVLGMVALIMRRQLSWRAFEPARALRLPAVLAVIGAVEILTSVPHGRMSAVEVLLLAVEVALSVGVGAAMGRLTAFRQDPTGTGVLQARTGWGGVALWVVLIAVRVGLGVAAALLGATDLTGSGLILLLVAATRATSALVVRARAPHALPLSASSVR